MKNVREDWLEGRPSTSNSEAEGKQWTTLWKVKVPSKIRVFLWRLVQQSLPTGDMLAHRHMAENSRCAIYGEGDSWRHSLLSCTMARCVWSLVDEHVTEHMAATEEPSSKQWLFAMMGSLEHDEFIKMVVTLWAIWHARRKAIHENTFQSPLSTFAFVERFIEEISPGVAYAPPRQRSRQPAPRWLPPPAGCTKINVDAAVAKTANMGAVAAVARDEEGVYQGASAVTYPGITDPATLEAIACREADLGVRRLMVGSDCLEVIKAIHVCIYTPNLLNKIINKTSLTATSHIDTHSKKLI
ncbi:hypothetical protein BRADI_1g43072v3 [Brachypodium distachyon]|uniref:Reverse transcriptase zinc-binding domain-containing protein n=1 Tax=Brachypodium distachyon TaxID=15368 RepID=A0A2K2DP05_BRADI|nr:hypothetical protein BRADI_1g43072v3 [Brachypodium distachyon]